LIPDLQDGVAHAVFYNGLFPGKFKFSLAKSKVATLAEALRKAQSFIKATKICAGDEPQYQENKKRSGENHDAQPDKHSKPNNERGGRFHTSPHDILMEINGSLLLRRPKPSKRQLTFGTRTNIIHTMRILVIQHQSAGAEEDPS